MKFLDEIHLPDRAVRGLGILLIIVGIALPALAVVYRAVTWEPSDSSEVRGPFRPELVILPKGTFQRGSDSDETLHEVTISKRFALSRTEITQGQYFAVMGERPVEGRGDSLEDRCVDVGLGDDLPVVCVNWLEAVRFCNALSELEGLEQVYTIKGSEVTWNQKALGYRLPTEAEWEYAARAGTRDRWAGTDEESEICEFANVADASAKAANPGWVTFGCNDGFEKLAPVKSKRPNRWRLYDMTGNVWEWVWDGEMNPTGDDTASFRVNRGGSWWFIPWHAHIAYRNRTETSLSGGSLGFRIARTLPPTF
jgi:formylglycine-generating enzyme required for sulfatase activity